MIDCANLLSLGFLNILDSFSKLAKNGITFIISDIFLFGANFTISESATKLFYILLI